MPNEWILDVLADLTEFARKNELARLERQLILARDEATKDLTSTQMFARGTAHQGFEHAGIIYRANSGGANT